MAAGEITDVCGSISVCEVSFALTQMAGFLTITLVSTVEASINSII